MEDKIIIKYINDHDVASRLGVELFDQDGNSISGGSGGASKDGITFDYEINALLDNYKNLKSIKIVPYIYSTKKDSKFTKQNKQILFEDKAIEIKLNK